MGWTEPAIIQIVPDWFAPQHLALAWEKQVGNGQLLMTSIAFTGDLDPARRQLRESLHRYWHSDAVQPRQELPANRLLRLIT